MPSQIIQGCYTAHDPGCTVRRRTLRQNRPGAASNTRRTVLAPFASVGSPPLDHLFQTRAAGAAAGRGGADLERRYCSGACQARRAELARRTDKLLPLLRGLAAEVGRPLCTLSDRVPLRAEGVHAFNMRLGPCTDARTEEQLRMQQPPPAWRVCTRETSLTGAGVWPAGRRTAMWTNCGSYSSLTLCATSTLPPPLLGLCPRQKQRLNVPGKRLERAHSPTKAPQETATEPSRALKPPAPASQAGWPRLPRRVRRWAVAGRQWCGAGRRTWRR